MATERLYWMDDHATEATAVIVAVRGRVVALDQTCFYAGGGGQPCDSGWLRFGNRRVAVIGVEADTAGVVWHTLDEETGAVGEQVALEVDGARREALSRYHTVLHVVNTIALRDYGAWITGAQIGSDYSRIDFKWEGFTPAVAQEMEQKVNAVLATHATLRAFWLEEAEFARRTDLLRTLEVRPPVHNGQVRVVAIEGFDEQACGGTHVQSLAAVGRFTVTRTENKGRINKRLYVRLD
jgi:misacylated tRNA(Ala) deacylase